MPPFSRTNTALAADRFGRSTTAVLVAVVVLGAWLAWATLARVSLYEVTDRARVEASRAAHVVQAPVDGTLVSATLAVGRHVEAGEPLVVLDSRSWQLDAREQDARLAGLQAQVDALARERQQTERAADDDRRVTAAAVAAARSAMRESEAPAALAEENAARAAKLRADGLLADADASQRRADAAQRRAQADSAGLVVARLEREADLRDRERRATLERLAVDRTRLEGEIASTRAVLERLQYEIDRRTIRASVAGVLGEVAVLRPGAVLKEAETLAAIVPADTLRLVAEYPPASALGRIRAGQPARLRLHGFPWAQYGSLPARVDMVATEVRNGTVRVELRLLQASASPIPLQHGLPGSVEIEVERIAPATLALRLAGRLATSPRGTDTQASLDAASAH